jgi:hypothetical protein
VIRSSFARGSTTVMTSPRQRPRQDSNLRPSD